MDFPRRSEIEQKAFFDHVYERTLKAQCARGAIEHFFDVAGTVLTIALGAMWLLVGAKTVAGAWRGNLFVSPCIAATN